MKPNCICQWCGFSDWCGIDQWPDCPECGAVLHQLKGYATHKAISQGSGLWVSGKYDQPYPGHHFIDEHDCDGTPSTPIEIVTLSLLNENV